MLSVMANLLMAMKYAIIYTNIGSKLASQIASSDRDFNTYFSRTFNSSFSLLYTDQTELLSICSNLKVKTVLVVIIFPLMFKLRNQFAIYFIR